MNASRIRNYEVGDLVVAEPEGDGVRRVADGKRVQISEVVVEPVCDGAGRVAEDKRVRR